MRERGGLSLYQVARLRQFYTREREKEEEEEEEGEREEEERKVEKAIPRTTSHPRIAHGQRYPMPCLE